MAKVLTFTYPDCGFEVNIPMRPGQGKTELSRRMGPVVTGQHRRNCEPCRQRRKEQWAARRTSQELTVQFRAGIND